MGKLILGFKKIYSILFDALIAVVIYGLLVGAIYFAVCWLVALKYSNIIITVLVSTWLIWDIDIKIEKVLMFYDRVKRNRALRKGPKRG